MDLFKHLADKVKNLSFHKVRLKAEFSKLLVDRARGDRYSRRTYHELYLTEIPMIRRTKR